MGAALDSITLNGADRAVWVYGGGAITFTAGGQAVRVARTTVGGEFQIQGVLTPLRLAKAGGETTAATTIESADFRRAGVASAHVTTNSQVMGEGVRIVTASAVVTIRARASAMPQRIAGMSAGEHHTAYTPIDGGMLNGGMSWRERFDVGADASGRVIHARLIPADARLEAVADANAIGVSIDRPRARKMVAQALLFAKESRIDTLHVRQIKARASESFRFRTRAVPNTILGYSFFDAGVTAALEHTGVHVTRAARSHVASSEVTATGRASLNFDIKAALTASVAAHISPSVIRGGVRTAYAAGEMSVGVTMAKAPAVRQSLAFSSLAPQSFELTAQPSGYRATTGQLVAATYAIGTNYVYHNRSAKAAASFTVALAAVPDIWRRVFAEVAVNAMANGEATHHIARHATAQVSLDVGITAMARGINLATAEIAFSMVISGDVRFVARPHGRVTATSTTLARADSYSLRRARAALSIGMTATGSANRGIRAFGEPLTVSAVASGIYRRLHPVPAAGERLQAAATAQGRYRLNIESPAPASRTITIDAAPRVVAVAAEPREIRVA